MKNLLNLMRFDLITAVCSAGNKQTAAYILIALVFLILAFFGMPLMLLLLFEDHTDNHCSRANAVLIIRGPEPVCWE